MSKSIHATRTQTMDGFEDIDNIFDIGISSELNRALQIERIQSINHLFQMNKHEFTTMEFMKENVPTPVPKYQVASLRLFIEYCKYRTWAGNPTDDFHLLTQGDIDEFNLMAPVTVTLPIHKFSTYPPTTYDLAMKEFNKGIKRDPNHFQAFTNERTWLDYKDYTIATANSQNVEDILDPTFVPINSDTIDLFS